ncbi:DCC1-like thiol-disulfide oxidoreductase family protein [Halapricum hydrolyticum]|uniref:DUF393 domain-containing protein n=1 Tax=Halapricum hydrolyticum TaxID=2979991 RepID=A0AAE3IE10_9EURY|nr:DCC1-like thiol-disulfide oxidoreductase family protein [Halapricum hydrolyticum]MCU4719433.1 DUF393 domain-containing protein [Halapricum hydrolyticum]MCU4728442.1 DUF393 domain-containing protein [Halapricum hydrolyticum]
MADPTLVYDDDCEFCTWAAEFIANRSEVELVGFSELTDDLRDRLPADYETCAHLVVDDTIYSCGASIERAFVRTDLGEGLAPVVRFLDQFEDYARVRERVYQEIADRRGTLGKLVR